MSEPHPDRHLRHAYAVLRWDEFMQFDDPTDSVTGTKAYLSQSEADAECERLNKLHAGRGVRYFVRLVRLALPPLD